MNENTGHGHVRPRPDGIRARCGGPGLCRECSQEMTQLNAAPPARQWGFTPPGAYYPPYLNVTETKPREEFRVTVRGERKQDGSVGHEAAILMRYEEFRDYVRNLAVDLGLGPIN